MKFYSLLISSLLILIVLFVSCEKSHLDKSEIINYVNEPNNGLSYTESHNGINYKVSYRPAQLLFDNDSARDEISNEEKKYPSCLYLVLEINKDPKLNVATSSQRTEDEIFKKVSFNVPEYMVLTNDKGDTLSLLDYNFPRYYGLSKETKILMAFENYNENDHEVTLNISPLFLGESKKNIRFKIEDIKKLNDKIN